MKSVIDSSLQYRFSMQSVKHKLRPKVKVKSPKSLGELKLRLDNIKGVLLKDLADALDIPLPKDNVSGKGFAGQLVELILGADAKTLPLPDFMNLSLELKTISVDENLIPQDPTFLCLANLKPYEFIPFEKSALYHKVRLMLFVFVLANAKMPFSERKILGYYFYKPSDKDISVIKQDYDEFMELIASGKAHEIKSSMGTYVQMMPKAVDGSALTKIINEDGSVSYTRPRAFYLRRDFVKRLCASLMTTKNSEI